MGCSFSCKRFSTSSSSKSKIIRIIHLNGYLEEIDYPVTVAEVTGKPTSHFLFTQAQFLAPGPTPLKLDTPLEPNRVYFLLPFSLFDANVSPVDLAPIARKLALVAQNSRSKSKLGKKKKSSSSVCANNPAWRSPARSPKSTETGSGEVLYEKSSKTRSWKPILSTIRERSFNRRESDLQENVKG